jgi:hypothetical protein
MKSLVPKAGVLGEAEALETIERKRASEVDPAAD